MHIVKETILFQELKEINSRPKPFQFYTANELWTNEYTAKQMLQYHLNADIDRSSRNHAFIWQSVDWITAYFKVGAVTKIADFGCAVGLYSNALAEKGAKVTGIDFSGNSLNYAKKVATEKGLNVNYVHADYLEFETDEKFDLILMITILSSIPSSMKMIRWPLTSTPLLNQGVRERFIIGCSISVPMLWEKSFPIADL